jgi:hypothetical protein
MPKVAFLIPASPSRAFFSQIAAFDMALRQLSWERWQPSVMACMGGEADWDAFDEWAPYLRDVAMMFAPHSDAETNKSYYAQIDGLFRWAPRDADVLVRMDADTLPVGNFEDVLDHVSETGSIAGVIAHIAFPTQPGASSYESWLAVREGLINAPLDFKHAYSFAGPDAPDESRRTPFYLNDGAVFIPKLRFSDFADRFLYLRPRVMDRLADPYYSGQVALALAVAELQMPTCALPMRYNFPNDELAVKRFPEELENVAIFHYLRTHDFDRQRIFADQDSYDAFLTAPLTGANKSFQAHVRRIFGADFPFKAASPRAFLASAGNKEGNRTIADGATKR